MSGSDILSEAAAKKKTLGGSCWGSDKASSARISGFCLLCGRLRKHNPLNPTCGTCSLQLCLWRPTAFTSRTYLAIKKPANLNRFRDLEALGVS